MLYTLQIEAEEAKMLLQLQTIAYYLWLQWYISLGHACRWHSFFSSLHQRAQEEVHSKELKVKLLTDSVNSFIAKAPPTAHDALRSELDVLTANYQRLCSRLDGKCKTLEVWSLSLCCSNLVLASHVCRKYLRQEDLRLAQLCLRFITL